MLKSKTSCIESLNIKTLTKTHKVYKVTANNNKLIYSHCLSLKNENDGMKNKILMKQTTFAKSEFQRLSLWANKICDLVFFLKKVIMNFLEGYKLEIFIIIIILNNGYK